MVPLIALKVGSAARSAVGRISARARNESDITRLAIEPLIDRLAALIFISLGISLSSEVVIGDSQPFCPLSLEWNTIWSRPAHGIHAESQLLEMQRSVRGINIPYVIAEV